MGEVGEERGQSFCRSVFLISVRSSLAWGGFAAPSGAVAPRAGESSEGGMNPALSLSSLVPLISSELSVLSSHNSPKPTALMEAPLALEPLLEITPCKA